MLAQSPTVAPLDKADAKWVEQTLKKMTLEEKVGQLLVSSFQSDFMSTDSEEFDRLAREVRENHVGGFHVFGASELAPAVLLNPTYGTVTLGRPLEAASILNRLQALSPVPLLNTADFETASATASRGDPLPARDGVWRGRRREARLRSRADQGRGSARSWRPRQFLSGRRRQQQRPQSSHQHAIVRRGPRPRVRHRAPPTSMACRRPA